MTANEFKKYCYAIGAVKTNERTKVCTVDRQKATELLGVSDRSIDRYLKNGCDNRPVISHLLTLVFGCNQGGVWAGWRLDGEFLHSPYGWKLSPEYIRELRQLAHQSTYANNRIKEIEIAMAEMHRIGETTNHKRIIGLATELLEALDHKSQIYTNYLDLTRDNAVKLRA